MTELVLWNLHKFMREITHQEVDRVVSEAGGVAGEYLSKGQYHEIRIPTATFADDTQAMIFKLRWS